MEVITATVFLAITAWYDPKVAVTIDNFVQLLKCIKRDALGSQ